MQLDHLALAVRDDRLARDLHRRHAPCGDGATGARPQSLATPDDVELVDQVGLRVVPADADVVARKHLAQLVADDVDDRLEVELGGHPLLDAVDHRQLGVALLGFLQQALRLVEQARVLERDAHAGDDRLQQPDLARAERVLALEAFDDDDADDAFVGDDLHRQARKRALGALRDARGCDLGRGVANDDAAVRGDLAPARLRRRHRRPA